MSTKTQRIKPYSNVACPSDQQALQWLSSSESKSDRTSR